MHALMCDQGDVYWKEFKRRSDYLSATQFAPMLNCGSKSKSSLWKEYHQKKKRPFFTSFHTEMGVREEEPTLRICVENLGIKQDVYRPGIVLDIGKHPYSCSPDALFIRNDEMIGIEIKNTTHNVPVKVLNIKPEYLVQCFTSLHITGAKHWILFTKQFMTENVSCFFFGRDDALWESIKEEAREFMSIKNTKEPGRRTKKDSERTENLFLSKIRKNVTWAQIPLSYQ